MLYDEAYGRIQRGHESNSKLRPPKAGTIGKRYRRMDEAAEQNERSACERSEVGTPFCCTVDFDTLEAAYGQRVLFCSSYMCSISSLLLSALHLPLRLATWLTGLIMDRNRKRDELEFRASPSFAS